MQWGECLANYCGNLMELNLLVLTSFHSNEASVLANYFDNLTYLLLIPPLSRYPGSPSTSDRIRV